MMISRSSPIRARLPLKGDEDSDTTATAQDLGTPLAVAAGSGLITTHTDVDYFRFELLDTELVTIHATPAATSPNLDIGMTLLDSSGAPIGSVVDPLSATVTSDVASGLDAELAISLGAGVYYVKVDGVSAGDLTTGYSDYASIGVYDVDVRTGVCSLGDPNEDDDTRATAQLLVAGQSATGTSCDADWFVVPGIAGTTLTATLTADDADLDLELTDAAGVAVGTPTPGTSSDSVTYTIPAEGDGDYFLGVSGAAGVESRYSLSTAMDACSVDDQWEPDDSWATASAMTNPGTKDGAICGAAAVDNALVDLTAGQPTEVVVDYPPTVGSGMYPWLYDGANWTGASASSAGQKRIFYTPASTQTFLVQLYQPSATDEVPYRLTVRPLTEPAPTVTSMSKTSGSTGQTLNIYGTDLYTVSSVDFPGAPGAAFTVNSASSITATVPLGATDGPITLTNTGGSTDTPWFDVVTFYPPPPMDDFANRQQLRTTAARSAAATSARRPSQVSRRGRTRAHPFGTSGPPRAPARL